MGTYDRTIFFDEVRHSLFGGTFSQDQVDGIDAILDYIDHLVWHPSSADTKFFDYWNAYLLGTTFHETARTMQPIEEYGKGSGRKYGTPDAQTGQTYYGRGFVQLTWRENYARSDARISEETWIPDQSRFPGGKVNQEWHAEQALDLHVASVNLFNGCHEGWYTGHKLWDHLTNTKKDYYNARRIVNGTDRAADIAGYAEKFEVALVAAWQSEAVAPVDPVPPEAPMPPPVTAPYPAPVMDLFAETGCQRIAERRGEYSLVYFRPVDM